MATVLSITKVDERANFVKNRLLEINRQASNIVIENGQLLREYKENAYHKEDGFKSFDEAIQAYHDSGLLDYGPRQARYFIAVIDMVEKHALEPAQVNTLGISKLREIATLPGEVDQTKLLDAAKDMSVGEVQKEAKRLRDKAFGRESDPFDPFMLKTTESQKEMLHECLKEARRIYAIEDSVSDTVVLIDHILAEWHGDRDRYEAEQIQGMQ